MDNTNLLVVLDPNSDNQVLLERALNIARSTGGRLHLLAADYNNALNASYKFNPQAVQGVIEGHLNSIRRRMDDLLLQLEQQGLAASGEVRWASPLYEAVLTRADEVGAGLIMKQTHHHSTLNRAFFTNNDWHLIREAKAPLWFVRGEHQWKSSPRILAAVDPVHARAKDVALDQRILKWSQQVASGLAGQLEVLHVYEVVPTGLVTEFDAMMADYPAFRQEIRDHHRQALEHLIADHAPAASSRLEDGLPEQVLPRIVREDGIDLTVMGAVSRSGLDRVFIGSTAERVLDDLDSDVLVVR